MYLRSCFILGVVRTHIDQDDFLESSAFSEMQVHSHYQALYRASKVGMVP